MRHLHFRAEIQIPRFHLIGQHRVGRCWKSADYQTKLWFQTKWTIGQVRADDGEVITKEVHDISGTISTYSSTYLWDILRYEILWDSLRSFLWFARPTCYFSCGGTFRIGRLGNSAWNTKMVLILQAFLFVVLESTAARTKEAQSISRPEVRWIFLPNDVSWKSFSSCNET